MGKLSKTAKTGGGSDSGEKFFNGVAPLVLGVAITGKLWGMSFTTVATTLPVPQLST
jgi:hypothetical protein